MAFNFSPKKAKILPLLVKIIPNLRSRAFSEMMGKHIWVLGDGNGLSFKPKGIMALRGDGGSEKGVVFADIANEFIQSN